MSSRRKEALAQAASVRLVAAACAGQGKMWNRQEQLHAAAGGVGLLMGQWLKALGATTIGTVGSPAKAELARDHGYDHVIDYRSDDFVATALGVMGADEALAFATRHDIAARIVAGEAEGFAESLSPALAAMLA